MIFLFVLLAGVFFNSTAQTTHVFPTEIMRQRTQPSALAVAIASWRRAQPSLR
ncbi:hypothetical protein H4S14_003196 [Agrobacterium vitis]|nr:hypothetical protein [Agrobacterium vitis]MBE1439431.1 hypothetical protein [Agrobacterium vitis]